jgi:hypothetical protein
MYVPRSIMLLVIGVLLALSRRAGLVGDVGSSWYRPIWSGWR